MNREQFYAIMNGDGTLDASFDPVQGPDSDVYCLALQQDGRIVVGGNFTTAFCRRQENSTKIM